MQCKSGGKKHGNKRYKEYIPLQKLKMEIKQEGLGWKHNNSERVFTNTTSAPYKSFICSQVTY